MSEQDSAIVAIGTANPAYKMRQSDIAAFIASRLELSKVQNRLLKSIYRASGIDERYTVLSDFPKQMSEALPSTAMRMQIYKKHALALALKAIHSCLATIDNYSLSNITHVLTVSCTGMYAPGIDIEIVQTLKLSTNTQRTAINFMGCYGAFNAIKLADAICCSDHKANVLVVCVELCSIHFQNSATMDNIISNSLFADGAAALLIKRNDGMSKCLLLNQFHNDLIPQTATAMAWEISDSGFDIVLSSYVSEVIESGINQFFASLLSQQQLNMSDIDFFAIHPGGIKILQACEAALKIGIEKNKYSYQTLRNYGNMSSATVLFVLKAIWEDLTMHDHQKRIFSCAFGPGLTMESMLLTAHAA